MHTMNKTNDNIFFPKFISFMFEHEQTVTNYSNARLERKIEQKDKTKLVKKRQKRTCLLYGS